MTHSDNQNSSKPFPSLRHMKYSYTDIQLKYQTTDVTHSELNIKSVNKKIGLSNGYVPSPI
jgi:hypothetical protein